MALFVAAFDAEIAAAHRAFPAVDVNLIKAVIATESQFKPKAVRGEPQRGDASRGLMQLLYQTARGLGYGGTPDNLFYPAVNVYYGTKLLAQLYGRLGEWDAVFSAYNGGVRPALGFGARATKPLRAVCLARDATGRCIKARDVPVGQFANQEYVDRVRRYLRYFGHQPAGGGAGALALGLLAALAALKGA